MSTYEWEKGAIKLPSSKFAGFKRDLIRKYNEIMGRRYEAAVDLYAKLCAAGKGKRHFDWEKAFQGIQAAAPYKYEGVEYPHLICLRSGLSRPRKPQKKTFPKLVFNVNIIPCDEASISFQKDTREVVWDVPENNHAREVARGSEIAKAFFRLLDAVKWVRGSGGVIVANDEYNRQDCNEGGGGNYVVDRYGPLGKRCP